MNKEERDKLVLDNKGLVYDIANHYIGYNIDLEDLVQEGFVGLVTAASSYNPEYNVRFDTYAYYWIKKMINDAVIKKSKIIRIPVHLHELLIKVERAMSEYYAKYDKSMTIEQLSCMFGVSEERIKKILSHKETISYDITVDEEMDLSLIDVLPGTYDTAEEAIKNVTYSELYDVIKNASLTDKELAVIYYLFGFDDRKVTEEEVAKIIKTSRKTVSLLKNKAILKLRKEYSCKKVGEVWK